MQSINFADWELTQMLPAESPYGVLNKWCVEKEIVEVKQEGYGKPMLCDDWDTDECFYTNFKLLRDAWTWEDIRLYLESKGYLLKMSPYVDVIDENSEDFQILYYFDIVFSSTGEAESDFTYYHSYEEARKEAIIYSLNQINNE